MFCSVLCINCVEFLRYDLTTFMCGCTYLGASMQCVLVYLCMRLWLLSLTGSLCILGTEYIVCVFMLFDSTSLLNSPLVMVLSWKLNSRYWIKRSAISCAGSSSH